MRIDLVGGTNQQLSLPFNAERSVNLYPVLDARGKDVAALYGTPGLDLFAVAGAGACRKTFAAPNGRAFIVSGNGFYEIDSAGTVTSRGSLLQSSGNVTIAENGTQIAICDGTNVYIFTYSSNNFAKVTDVDLPSSGTIDFIDGYFVVNENNSIKYYISAPYDGTSWEALDFSSAESSSDYLLRVFNGQGLLWLFKKHSIEIHQNVGASDFPFREIAGATIDIGILAPHSVVSYNNTVIWLGRSNYGSGIVYASSNTNPQKISTEPINLLISQATNPEEITAYLYQKNEHTFYVLTGGGLPTSLVYDFTTNFWHERAYLDAEGNFTQHRAYDCMFVFNKHIVGDRVNGNVYEMSNDVYSDNGDSILRERIYTHIFKDNERLRISELSIGFETGVGLVTGQGSDPQASLSLSRDGGKTYTASHTRSIGAIGKYNTEVTWRRLGIQQQTTFRLRISDPVKVAITGSYMR